MLVYFTVLYSYFIVNGVVQQMFKLVVLFFGSNFKPLYFVYAQIAVVSI